MLIHTTETAEPINENKMLHRNRKIHLLFAAFLMGLCASTFAADSSDTDASAYVDSAYEWGSWELGLQPAAGGQAPSPKRVVTARNVNTQFRANDSSAFAPNARVVRQTNINPTPLPTSPAVSGPTAPTAPPPATPGTGGPGDIFF